jgi:hypothetical protein
MRRNGLGKILLTAGLVAMVEAVWAAPACAQSGACCSPLPTGGCTIDTAANCALAGGNYRGDDTTCESCLGACCVGGSACTRETQFDCNAAGGVFSSYSTDCESPCECDVVKFNFQHSGNASNTGTFNGGQVNISGATLFVDFFEQPAITNDFNNPDHDEVNLSSPPCPAPDPVSFKGFLDTDCNGVGNRVDQLAPSYVCGLPFEGHWIVNYRAVGSVEGFGEFVDYQLLSTIPTNVPSERGLLNRQRYANLGAQVAPLNACVADSDCDTLTNDESGTPVLQNSVDISNTDVPSAWTVQGPTGSAVWHTKPTASGYGQNAEGSHHATLGGYPNLMATLVRGPLSLNLNNNPPATPAPDANTIFDTVTAWSPVCCIASRGVGRENIRYTEMQYVVVTGRLPNGENLTACVRDAGSGTRNTFANAIGVDPSWCVGDHLGPRVNTSQEVRLGVVNDQAGTEVLPIGSRTQPTNCGGSGIMEDAVTDRRLAIGFTGYFGASRASEDTAAGRYEMLSVCKDIDGNGDGLIDSDCSASACAGGPANQAFPGFPAIPGCPNAADELTPANSGYVRPSVSTILDNDDPHCGYQIGAAQTFGTRGDPESGRGGNTHPAMANLAARDYIRNISDSLLAFAGNPPSDVNFNMPGEAIARNFMPTASADGLPLNGNPTNPTSGANPGFVQSAQDYVRCSSITRTYTFGSVNVAGLVPRRNDRTAPAGPGGTYNDGSVNGRYWGWNGAAFVANLVIGNTHRLNVRNRIAGDFDNNGLRNINDIPDLMLALQNPRAFQVAEGVSAGTGGGVAGTPTFDDFVIPEVLGDFDGDGNFDSLDARYFADGLALDTATGKLDRKQGFIDVDDEWFALTANNNYFGTLPHSTGTPYKSGDSRGDVAGSAQGPFRGAFPNGQDLLVNAKDIDYVYANRGDWGAFLDHAALTDLSCDMDGNLLVDQRDVDQIVHTILCTEYGDVNLDSDVNIVDSNILQGINPVAPFPRAGGWADGDMNGDKLVNASDLAILNANFGFNGPLCLSKRCGDIDGDNDCDDVDTALFVQVLLGNVTTVAAVERADLNSDTKSDGLDVQRFVCCRLNLGADSFCP